MTETASTERLLEHVTWIRALARQLVADAHAADDLAQEACVAALEHPPRHTDGLRAWFASVLRNLARERSRGELRRSAREHDAARCERLEASDTLVSRAEIQRELVAAVLELDDPYRTAVLLRWFEELPPAAIAARLGVPIASVHSRLQRALAMLRARLDRAHGRAVWSALFLPAAKVSPLLPLPTPLWIGALSVNAKLIAAAVFVAAAATAVFVFQRDTSDAGDRPGAARAALPARPRSELLADGRAAPGDAPRSSEREEASAPRSPPAAEAAVAAEPELWTVRGRALGGEAQPLASLRLKVPDTELRTESGQYGRFAFETRVTGGQLVVDDARWVTVRAAVWSKGSSYEPIAIAAPAIDLAGSVADSERNPLPGARVHLELPRDFTSRFASILEGTQTRGWVTTADEFGAFTLSSVPAVSGSRLRAVLEGYAVAEQPAPEITTGGLAFVLARPKVPLAGSVRGRVLDPAGLAVAGARVAVGVASVATSEQGEFAIDLAHAVTAERLTAVAVGYLPVTLERPGEPEEKKSGWPDFVTLQLGGSALSIAGRVVDEHGEPVGGAKLWIADPTPFGVIGAMPAQLEHLMAGAEIPPQAFDIPMFEEDGDHFRDWTMRAGPANALWNWTTTDAEGRFEIDGLQDRSYRFQVMLEKPLAMQTSDSIPAGEHDARIRMRALELFPVLKGRVVSDRGEALAGVRVQSLLPVVDVKSRVYGGTHQVILTQPGPTARTDADGRFELDNIPMHGAELQLASDAIVPAKFDVLPTTNAEDFTITVHARCHLQLELLPPIDRADTIEILDGEGRGLDLLIISGNSVNAYTDVPISDGRSEVFSVSSQARTLVLSLDGEEVERVALDLQAGEINRIRR